MKEQPVLIMLRRLKPGLLVLLMAVADPCAANALEIKLPNTTSFQGRDSFEMALLDLLLTKIPGEHQLTRPLTTLTQARVIAELKKQDGLINLHWMGTSSELEEQLHAIYFPIYRGLGGYRVFIINKDYRERFASVDTVAKLRKFTGAQALGWTDIDILEAAGLRQFVAPYDSIFQLVDKKRVDYFSRNVLEVSVELQATKFKGLNITMEPNVLLIYPFALYYFASNKALADQISAAFEAAYDDGSLVQFFYSHPKIAKALDILHQHKRQVIEIDNPSLSERTKQLAAKYWHQSDGNETESQDVENSQN